MALINNNTKHSKTLGSERGQTEPGLVTFYVIQSGNGAGLFLHPQSPHGETKHRQLNNLLTL